MLMPMPASAHVTDYCPVEGIQPRTNQLDESGIILTTFDGINLWAYDVDRNRRYPLPNTAPCGGNCNLSPDGLWFTYFNTLTRTLHRMQLNGAETVEIADYATEAVWWSDERFLIWSPDKIAYLRDVDSTIDDEIRDRDRLDTTNIFSIAPGSETGIGILQEGDDFIRVLYDSEREITTLGRDLRYFNAGAWSPDGTQYAYVNEGTFDETNRVNGAEIFAISPDGTPPQQWTDLFARYGATRINGVRRDNLSWSPDGTQLAFWVIEMLGSAPDGINARAIIHTYDLTTNTTTAYCGFSTRNHTPYTPRLAWSPDSANLAFSVNVADRTGGNLLITLALNSGIYTELSSGVYSNVGVPDVYLWGRQPE